VRHRTEQALREYDADQLLLAPEVDVIAYLIGWARSRR
jgi:hypothetical protein